MSRFVYKIVLCLLSCSLCSANEFVYSLTTKAQNMAIDDKTNMVYVGAADYIYVFEYSKWELIKNVSVAANDGKINYNAVLLVNQPDTSLVECGTDTKGACTIRNLPDISSVKLKSSSKDFVMGKGLVSSSLTSTVAAIKHKTNQSDLILFAKSYDETSGSQLSLVNMNFDCPCASIAFDCCKVKYKTTFDEQNQIAFKSILNPSDSFMYILTNQKTLTTSKYISKIIQFCLEGGSSEKQDINLYSYIDIPLEFVNKNNTHSEYNWVQSAVTIEVNEDLRKVFPELEEDDNTSAVLAAFSSGTNPHTLSGSTAFCLMSYKAIQERMTEARANNYNECIASPDEYNKHIHDYNYLQIERTETCSESQGVKNLSQSFCYHLPFTRYFEGLASIVANESKAIMCHGIHSNAKYSFTVTAMLVKYIDQFTLVFIGTSDGHVRKFRLSDPEEIDVEKIEEGSPIKDLVLVDDEKYLLVLTENKLVKMPLEKCGQLETADDCFNSRDPMCGWCILEQKCSIKSECIPSDQANQWLSVGNNERPKLSLNQNSEWINGGATVKITVENVPRLVGTQDKYELWFNEEFYDFNVTPLPYDFSLRNAPTLEKEMQIKLYLKKSSGKRVMIASADFLFYDCQERKSCAACNGRGSKYKILCSWCDYQSCKNVSDKCAVNITEIGSCPMLFKPDMKISSGQSAQLELTGKNLPKATGLDYECVFASDSAPPNTVKARWNSDSSLTCNSKKFEFKGDGAVHDLKVNITYKDVIIDPEDADKNLQVELYKCEHLAKDCCTCVDQDPRLGCHWAKSCKYSPSNQDKAYCEPVVTSIHPINGTVCGNTKLTIVGVNFHCSGADNQLQNLLIGSRECIIDEKNSSRITCRTGAVSSPESGNIKKKKVPTATLR